MIDIEVNSFLSVLLDQFPQVNLIQIQSLIYVHVKITRKIFGNIKLLIIGMEIRKFDAQVKNFFKM